ncbi:unnamed protein product [Acanthoscelides obtectus]|uniref:diphthine methyl ester synthase n=1 Tax=Acanthoscelides obtectus TaxID=200917 RepID=A0A9P0K6Z6_ACAOB|nr:unnamed protein product [Acanthoscelides obtectus]CAK1666926.1 Diphthine methyl ester synthase [Acanthoscelides obtectus]
MFYLIGLGLGDCKDITVKGLEIVKKCDKVYLESYTSILTCGVEALEQFYGAKLILADRDLIEQGADEILDDAKHSDVALLVVGDPFGATTHTDLVLRAKEKQIDVKCIHNASILSAIGCCGLQLYSFGETVSIPFWTDTWQPDSFFEKICNNHRNNLHTLCLLDIKVKEPTLESMTKKKKVYMDPRFMSVKEAAVQLLEILKKSESIVIDESSLCIGLARVGAEDQQIVACSLSKMASVDLGGPLHSFIVVGPKLHPLEEEYLLQFRIV